MNQDNGNSTNPFMFWQQFWENASPQVKAVLPPMSSEELDKKIAELKNIEVWLNFNLQAVRSQIAIFEQQRSFFESIKQVNDQLAKSGKNISETLAKGAKDISKSLGSDDEIDLD